MAGRETGTAPVPVVRHRRLPSERMTHPPLQGERGSATVLVVGLVAVIATLTVSVAAYLGAVITSHRARSAADLAAIAAATRLARGATVVESCRAAATTAVTNHSSLVECQAAGAAVVVRVEVRPAGRLLGVATARARAGAADDERPGGNAPPGQVPASPVVTRTSGTAPAAANRAILEASRAIPAQTGLSPAQTGSRLNHREPEPGEASPER